MLRGIHTDLLVTVTLIFLTQTGTPIRAENDFSLVTLPERRENSEYVSECFYDRHNNYFCDWTRNQQTTGDDAVNTLESGPLGMEGEACLEFWYLAGSDVRALLKSSLGEVEIWSSPALTEETWRHVFVPLNVTEAGTQVVFKTVQAASMEGQVTLKQIGVRRGSCGPQCESNTELWTDESTRCLCSDGQLSCSLSQCPQGQICGSQRGGSTGIFASGTCTIHSDTDCSTFDGVLFRFMAPCSYVLVKSCLPSEAPPAFIVEVVNEQNGNSSLSTVQQVVVVVGHHRISLMKKITRWVVVNGVWQKLPLNIHNVHIESNPVAVSLRTDFGLSVSYDSAGAVHVKLPIKYSDKVCGLCGNFNQLEEDDFRTPNGSNAGDATALAKSWQTRETSSSCETMLVPHQCDPLEEAEYASELYCGGLLSSTGPFSNCLSVVGAESYFRGCVVGMCSTHGDPGVLCETLKVYADICQEAGVAVPFWRNSSSCSLQCGENSHYNSCADGCPDVCPSMDIVGSCGSCVERCDCDPGYKLDGGKCVPAEGCGCWYEGKHYEKGETLMEGECVQQCKCMGNNELECKAMRCADSEVCKVKDGVKGCFAFHPVTCSVYGDPHYITFDGLAYDFQGGCSYTLMTTCGRESTVQFTVIGHNMHPALQNFTRSKLQAVSLQVDDLYLNLNTSGEVYVKNNSVGIPYFTNGTYGSVWVNRWNNYIILESTFGLRIMIDGENRLFLQVDDRYKYELCGLCGTYSEHQDDDFITPGGQNATGPFEFGDSWRLPGSDECVAQPNDPRVCDYEEENEAYNECFTLVGEPFKPCHERIHPSIYLNSCVYDYCDTSGDQNTLCESLKSYAAACEVAGVELLNWQMDTACVCPMNCDFEKNMCGWEQLIQDSFDWTRNSGSTPSDQTGPNQDHTTGAGSYMYIEGNSATHGDSARLISSTCHFNGPLCLHFWYHMYGSSSAMALNIFLLKGNKATKLWSRMNNQGPEWHPVNVDIEVSGPFQILVEAIRGSNDQSDVAIDDISIHFGSCKGIFPDLVSGTILPSTIAEIPSHTLCGLDCSFDSNLCSWSQMITDAFDWTWNSGSTPSLMTGPSADHTGDGHYLYIEASSVTHGDTARLISSECSDSGPQCLQFWYHMHGSADTMGLHVYLLQDRLANAVWWKRNDQGNMWQLAQVDFTTTGAFKIIIEGRRGSNEESDVAIDDVMLHHGRCADLNDVVTNPPVPEGNTTAPAPTSAREPPLVSSTVKTVTLPPIVEATTHLVTVNNVTDDSDNGSLPQPVCQLHCNFEQDVCQWKQLLTDVFDWTRHSGATPTMMTGPSSDHTTGDGHYLYIEANGVSHGDTARLISSECVNSGPQCLQFWYHMYGSADTMGLHVYLLQDRLANAVWWKRNDQGNTWHLAEVDLTTTGAFQIIFEGRRGSNDQSDVAIDDVSLHYGHCADLAKPVTPAPTIFETPATEGPELPFVNSTTATQPQTSTTQQPSTNQSTAKPQPTTENPQLETSLQPKPENTEQPQTTTWTDQPATSTNESQTTARPPPVTTEYPALETSEQPNPEITERPDSTDGPVNQTQTQATAQPQQPTTEGHLPLTSVKPQPPSTAQPQPPTTSQPQLPTTVKPQPPTTDGPQPPTSVKPQPPSTAQPQPTTTAQPQPPTTTQPPTTAQPQLPTSVKPQPPTTQSPTTAQPEAPTTVRPQPPTTAQPQPPTMKPQPPTTGGPQPPTSVKPQPTTTAQPHPPTTEGPQPQTSVKPQPPSTAQPQPPTTAQPQPPTSVKPQPPTTQSPTTAQPEAPTTVRPQPPTTGGPQPTTTAQPQPQTTAQPQPPTSVKPEPPTTAKPHPPTTVRPQPPTSVKPQPTTTAQPQPQTTAQPQPPTSVKPEPPTTAKPHPPTTVRPQPPTTAQPKPPTTAQPQPPTSVKPQPPTTEGPQPPTTAQPQPQTTAQPQPPTTAQPQPPITDGSKPSTTSKPNLTTSKPGIHTTASSQSTTTTRPSNTPVPTPSCPEDSHYTTCVPSCSPTCSSLNGPPHCSENEGCVQGCVCDDGFVQKGRVCVPIQLCGCVDRNGNKRQFSEEWYTSHCSEKCKCKKDSGVGRIECDDKDECDGNAVCLPNENDDYYCQSTGFSECSIKGDPEYRTFDRFKHDFEGRHSYVLIQTKNLPNNLQEVYIEGINRRTEDEDDSHHHDDSSSEEDNSHRIRDEDEDEDDDDDDDDDKDEDDSHNDESEEDDEQNGLRELKIRVYNHTVEFKKKRKLTMDGKRTNTPVSLPGLSIWQHSSRIYLKTDFGLSVEFDGQSEAEIILPNTYKRKVGGLCGNFDGRKQNDLMMPDGTRARNVQEFGESWRV
ncbi:mucin-2-like isoform X2 [Labrus bergylta]|uniref:mucin-2-like isoform X2 n=1 Tax=Labrus bergylta TaxID=56723 RepID=UPI00331343C6